jgi:hypothetical protein
MAWSNSSGAVRSRRRTSRTSTPTPLCYSTVNDRESNDEELNTILSIEKDICASAKSVTAHNHRKQSSLPLSLLPRETPSSLFRIALFEGAERLSTSLLLSNSWEQAHAACEQDAFRSAQEQHLFFGEESERVHFQQHRGNQNQNLVPLMSLQASFAEIEESDLPVYVSPKLAPYDPSTCGNFNLQHSPQKKSQIPVFNSSNITNFQQQSNNIMSQRSTVEPVSAEGMAATASYAEAPHQDQMTATGAVPEERMVAVDVSPLHEHNIIGGVSHVPLSTETGHRQQQIGPTSSPFRSPSSPRRSVVNTQATSTSDLAAVDGGILNHNVAPCPPGRGGLKVYPPFLFSGISFYL